MSNRKEPYCRAGCGFKGRAHEHAQDPRVIEAAAVLREKAGEYCAAAVRRINNTLPGSGDARRALFDAAVKYAKALGYKKRGAK